MPSVTTEPIYLYEFVKPRTAARWLMNTVAILIGLYYFVTVSIQMVTGIPDDAYLRGWPAGNFSLLMLLLGVSWLSAKMLVIYFPWCIVPACHRKDWTALRCARLPVVFYLIILALLAFLLKSQYLVQTYYYLDHQGIHRHEAASFGVTHYRWNQVRGIRTYHEKNYHQRSALDPLYIPHFELEMVGGARIELMHKMPDFLAAYPQIEAKLFGTQPNLPVTCDCNNETLTALAFNHDRVSAQLLRILQTGHMASNEGNAE